MPMATNTKSRSKLPDKKDLIDSSIGDKVRVMKFSVSPKKSRAGDLLRINFTVQNVSGAVLKLVPWRIVNKKTVLYSGYRFNLPSGSSFDVSTTWEARKGNHFLFVDIDPLNVLNEPRAKQYDNFPQGVDVVVGK